MHCHDEWGSDREWDERHTLNKSLAATTASHELSLSSLMFQDFCHCDLLRAIALFPQGVNEEGTARPFPTVANKNTAKFRILSLTYRNDGFITMLTTVLDYLSLPDPFLSSARGCRFSQL